MELRKIVAGAALALSMAVGAASAAPITGSVSIDFGTVTDSGAPLSPGTTLLVAGNAFSGPGSGTLLILAGSPIGDFSVTLTVGSPVVFTGLGGSYVGAVSSMDFFSGGAFANIVSVAGTFTPDPLYEAPVGIFPFGGLDANPDTQVNLTFTFIPGTVGGSYSGGGVMHANTPTTPENVPEPLSLGLFGLGLAGLGVAMRRRSKANQPV